MRMFVRMLSDSVGRASLSANNEHSYFIMIYPLYWEQLVRFYYLLTQLLRNAEHIGREANHAYPNVLKLDH